MRVITNITQIHERILEDPAKAYLSLESI